MSNTSSCEIKREFEGTAYVGLVAFLLEGLRAVGVPEAFALTFPETNARTYVHAGGADPGVYFFSLDAASRFAVMAARLTFGLPYYHARVSMKRDGPRIEFTTVRQEKRSRGAFLNVRYEPGEELGPAEPGSLDHFLLQRYFLHVTYLGRIW